MAVASRCPLCGERVYFERQLYGRKTPCPKCGGEIWAPFPVKIRCKACGKESIFDANRGGHRCLCGAAIALAEPERLSEDTIVREGDVDAEHQSRLGELMSQAVTGPMLIQLSGGAVGQRVPIAGAELKIGRKEDNDLVFDDPDVSKHHCRIVREDGGFVLEDLGSTNGTALNGLRIERQALKDWDVISMGSSFLVLRLPSAPGAEPQTAPAPSRQPRFATVNIESLDDLRLIRWIRWANLAPKSALSNVRYERRRIFEDTGRIVPLADLLVERGCIARPALDAVRRADSTAPETLAGDEAFERELRSVIPGGDAVVDELRREQQNAIRQDGACPFIGHLVVERRMLDEEAVGGLLRKLAEKDCGRLAVALGRARARPGAARGRLSRRMVIGSLVGAAAAVLAGWVLWPAGTNRTATVDLRCESCGHRFKAEPKPGVSASAATLCPACGKLAAYEVVTCPACGAVLTSHELAAGPAGGTTARACPKCGHRF